MFKYQRIAVPPDGSELAKRAISPAVTITNAMMAEADVTPGVNFKRILVPLDGSEMAERALVPALAIAEAMLAKVFFVRVAVPLSLNLDPKFYQSIIEGRQKSAQRYLRSIQSRFSSSPIDIEIHTVVGRAAGSIIKFAQDNEIDLLIMSGRGQSGIRRRLNGSVTTKILRRTPCATMIIRSDAEVDPFAHKRILVPLDGSQLAEQAVAPAAAIAGLISAELILLNIVTGPIEHGETIHSQHTNKSAPSDKAATAGSYVHEMQFPKSNGLVPIKTTTAFGQPVKTIVDYARKHDVDLIVISSRNRLGISRWIHGSMSEKVLWSTNSATLVV